MRMSQAGLRPTRTSRPAGKVWIADPMRTVSGAAAPTSTIPVVPSVGRRTASPAADHCDKLKYCQGGAPNRYANAGNRPQPRGRSARENNTFTRFMVKLYGNHAHRLKAYSAQMSGEV